MVDRQLKQARYAASIKRVQDNMIRDRFEFEKFGMPINKDFEPTYELPPSLTSLKAPIMASLAEITYQPEAFYSYLYNNNLINQFYENMKRFLSKGIYNKVNLSADDLIRYFNEYQESTENLPANVPHITPEKIEDLKIARRLEQLKKAQKMNAHADDIIKLDNELLVLYDKLHKTNDINVLTDAYNKIAKIYHMHMGHIKEREVNKEHIIKNEKFMRDQLSHYSDANFNEIKKLAEENVKYMSEVESKFNRQRGQLETINQVEHQVNLKAKEKIKEINDEINSKISSLKGSDLNEQNHILDSIDRLRKKRNALIKATQ